jgi:hypothetical protein
LTGAGLLLLRNVRERMGLKYIAVDFDGTLCEHAFPGIGEVKPIHKRLHDLIIQNQKEGCKIILWTCREDIPEGNYLTQAVDWCKTQGIEFDYINENPECDFGHPEKVRKIVADIYIDDKAFNPFMQEVT